MERGGDDLGPVGGDWLPLVVSAIGGGEFTDVFFVAVRQGFGVDHIVVFTFVPNGRAGTMAIMDRIPDRPAGCLAWDYAAANWFRRGPNLSRILESGATPSLIDAPLLARLYTPEYRLRRFLDAVDIVDKVAFSVRAEDGCLVYMNFHRLADTGRFDPATRSALIRHGAMLAATLVRHRQLAARSQRLDVSAPALDALTSREREVCAGILAGQTSEGIAFSLGVSPNTVLTLRRRTYVGRA